MRYDSILGGTSRAAAVAARKDRGRARRRLSAGAAILALVLGACAIRAGGRWTAVALDPGTRLIVMDVDGRVHDGQLAEWTPDGLAMKTASARVKLEREGVAVVRAAGPFGDLHTVYAPWENLTHLSIGQRIRIIRTDGIWMDGKLAGNTEEEISLEQSAKTVFVERPRIHKVRILLRSSTEEAAMIGATTGFLAALTLLVAALTQGASAEGAGILELGTYGGGFAGGTLASLFDQYQTVYLAHQL
jgi:hypothetical protein